MPAGNSVCCGGKYGVREVELEVLIFLGLRETFVPRFFSLVAC